MEGGEQEEQGNGEGTTEQDRGEEHEEQERGRRRVLVDERAGRVRSSAGMLRMRRRRSCAASSEEVKDLLLPTPAESSAATHSTLSAPSMHTGCTSWLSYRQL